MHVTGLEDSDYSLDKVIYPTTTTHTHILYTQYPSSSILGWAEVFYFPYLTDMVK